MLIAGTSLVRVELRQQRRFDPLTGLFTRYIYTETAAKENRGLFTDSLVIL